MASPHLLASSLARSFLPWGILASLGTVVLVAALSTNRPVGIRAGEAEGLEVAPEPRTAALQAPPPRVTDLAIQQQGDVTYFRVWLEAPPRLDLHGFFHTPVPAAEAWRFGQLPRLVPQDGQTRAVYSLWDLYAPVPADLGFVGQVNDTGKGRLLLLYPVRGQGKDGPNWAEATLELDFTTAKRLNRPQDLQRQWAGAEAGHFAALEALAPDFGFFSFARSAVNRKHGLSCQPWGEQAAARPGPQRLYEMTTGATAIAESLQLHRMLNADFRDRGERTVDIGRITGVTIAEHPWDKMMAGKKPAPEPLARLVPHDGYYIQFPNVRKFIEFGELIDEWGTNVIRGYEMTSRDFDLKGRYEKQLCLRSTALGKTLGPLVIRGLAVTGSDLYVREGSDVTVIFNVANPQLFLAAVEPFLAEARKEYGDQLKHAKSAHGGIAVESFVSPLREVSLHRALFGDYVVYSNSLAGLRRVLDTHLGKLKPLADSLDFQYMRTVFRFGDADEDGFAFLSDAFIRQLVGPASKIKEKRRLEALTSLYMLTHGAMFTAWQTGKLPADHAALLANSGLKPEEIYVPEGKAATWDAARRVAVSDVYNTIHFATPLVELAIDRVTPTEEIEYSRFRDDYLRLWRRFFDPIGMRVGLSDSQVKVETYILPLINSSQYNELRTWAGGGTAKFDPARISPHTLFQWMAHVDPSQRSGGLGSWLMFRIDDSPDLRLLAEHLKQHQLFDLFNRDLGTLLRLPMTFGLQVGDRKEFAESVRQLRSLAEMFANAKIDELKYREVPVVRTRFGRDSMVTKHLALQDDPPDFFSAHVDDAWYLSTRESGIHDLIDQSIARKKGDRPKDGGMVEFNSSLYLAPKAAVKAGPVLHGYLEWETHRRATANNALWHALQRSGLVTADASEQARAAAARQFFGFVPVSPDGAAYRYDGRTDEFANLRHGSLRQPHLHTTLALASPLARLLAQLQTIRADLRFREDGVHTVLQMERKP